MEVKNTEKERIRVQLDFSKEALDRLSALQNKVDASTRAEVVKNALWLYEWLITKAEENRGLKLSARDLRYYTRLKQSQLSS